MIFAFGAWMHLARSVFAKDFDHDRIRWVRKVSYPPAYLLQGFAIFLVVVASVLVWGAMSTLWVNIDFLQRSFLVSDYLFGVLCTGAMLFLAQCVLGLFARKVMVVGHSLWIKSLGYRSTTIDLEDIDSVEIHSPFEILSSMSFLKQVKHRYFYYDALVWRRGILICTKSGASYFVSVRDPVDAACELTSLLQKDHALARASATVRLVA